MNLIILFLFLLILFKIKIIFPSIFVKFCSKILNFHLFNQLKFHFKISSNQYLFFAIENSHFLKIIIHKKLNYLNLIKSVYSILKILIFFY
jgi:hypothetical protein